MYIYKPQPSLIHPPLIPQPPIYDRFTNPSSQTPPLSPSFPTKSPKTPNSPPRYPLKNPKTYPKVTPKHPIHQTALETLALASFRDFFDNIKGGFGSSSNFFFFVSITLPFLTLLPSFVKHIQSDISFALLHYTRQRSTCATYFTNPKTLQPYIAAMPRRIPLKPYRSSTVYLIANGIQLASAHATIDLARPALAIRQTYGAAYRIDMHAVMGGTITPGEEDTAGTLAAPYGRSTLYLLVGPQIIEAVFATRELADAALATRQNSGHGTGYSVITERLQGGIVVEGETEGLPASTEQPYTPGPGPTTVSYIKSHERSSVTNSPKPRKKGPDGGAGSPGNLGGGSPAPKTPGSAKKGTPSKSATPSKTPVKTVSNMFLLRLDSVLTSHSRRRNQHQPKHQSLPSFKLLRRR